MKRSTFLRGLFLAPVALLVGKTGLGALFPAEEAVGASGAVTSGKIAGSAVNEEHWVRLLEKRGPVHRLFFGGEEYSLRSRRGHPSPDDSNVMVVNELWVKRKG